MAQKNEIPKPGLKQEALAVLGIFISLFLYLSLISSSLKIKGNWCGEIGTLIAQVLFGFIGWGAYLLARSFAVIILSFFQSQDVLSTSAPGDCRVDRCDYLFLRTSFIA